MREERRLAPHQNDAGLAKNGQTVYAGSGSDMAEPTTIKEKPTEQVSNGEVRAVSKVAEIAVSKEEQTKEEVSKAIKQFVKEEVDKEESPQQIQAQEQQVVSVQGVKDYFPNIPAGLGGTVADFYRELQGLTAKDAYIYYKYIPSEFFIRYYLRLRKAAEEKGQDTAFLAEIKKELAARKIDADSLYSQAKPALTLERQRRRHWRGEARAGRVGERDAALAISRADLPIGGGAGGLDLSGITDRTLRERGEEINHQIAIYGEDLAQLSSRWSEISGLNGTVLHDQKELLLNEISRAMARAQEIRRKEEEVTGYSKIGISGERRLRTEDLKKIEGDIDRLVDEAVRTGRLPDGRQLRGENIDYYFNRIFDRAIDQPRMIFDQAVGNGGLREHEDFVRELNLFKQAAVDNYNKGYVDEKTGIRHGSREEVMAKKREIIDRFLANYGEEYTMRSLLHNAFFIAETEGEFKNFSDYCKSFASGFADRAFLESPEVEIALRVREYVLYEIKREHKEQIPPELVVHSPSLGVSYWESRSREIIGDLNAKGMLSSDGSVLDDDWRIDRAVQLSRGLGMVFLRFPEIVAETSTFGPTGAIQSKTSIPWEKLAWDLNPLDHRIKRYETQFGLRGFLYALKKRGKGHKLWNQDELRDAMMLDQIRVLSDDQRIIDLRNIFRTGGPFSWVAWRPFVAALEEDRTKFKALLGRNPGIAAKMFFNRYKYSHSFEKFKLWLQSEGHHTPDEFRNWLASEGYKPEEIKRFSPLLQPKTEEEAVRAWEDVLKNVLDKKEIVEEGEDKGKKLKRNVAKWREADRKAWRETVNRVPYDVLRVMLDEHSKLLGKEKRLDLVKEISQKLGIDYYSKDFSQVERDLVIAKENLMRRRRKARKDTVKNLEKTNLNPTEDKIQEKTAELFTEVEDQLKDEDFEMIGKGEKDISPQEIAKRIEKAKALRNFVRDLLTEDKPIDRERVVAYNQALMEAFLKMASVGEDANTQFTFGPMQGDVPYSEFRWEQTGARGTFARKINDAFAVSEAGDFLLELIKQMPNFQNAEQIVEQLKKIYGKVESYNKEAAQDAIGTLSIGIIRFFEKDGVLKFPVYGEMMQLLNSTRSGNDARGNSFAQTIYGGRAMAWDSDDIYNFTEMLKVMLVDKAGAKIIKRVREETGGTAWQGFFRKTKLAIYLLILFGFYEFASKLMTEKQ